MGKKSSGDVGLGPLQHQVLNLILARPGSTVRELLEEINSGASGITPAAPYAYTTIQAVCDALHRKQLVSRRRTKLAFHYKARTTSGGLFAEGLRSLVQRFSVGPQPIASGLLDSLEQESPEQLAALIAELKQRGKL
jgi:predicted transcriptional regulator